MACRKITLSVPNQLVDDLDYISGRIKISRSALLAQLLEEPLCDLRVLVESVPKNPSPDDIIRAKGRSIALIEERVTNAKGIADDLFSV